jgi:hypothetical protein
VVKEFKNNSGSILTAMAVVGMFGTVVLAVKATPKALALIEQDSIEKYGRPDLYSKKEAIQSAWKCYIPTVLMGTLSAGCMIGANSVHLRRNAALASMFSISEAALKEYQAKVIETIGEKKEQKIHDAYVQDQINKLPMTEQSVISTGKGETLCFESISGRYFKSDIESLRSIQNDLVYDVISRWDYLSVNDWFTAIGLRTTLTGDDFGWNTEHQLKLEFTAMVADNGQPCIVIEYRERPFPTFRDRR